MRLDASRWMLRRGWTATWSAFGNFARKSPQQKRSNNACKHERRNSTPVSQQSKPAWTHGRANSSASAAEPYGIPKTANGSGTLGLVLWVLRSVRGGCRWRVDGEPFPSGLSGSRPGVVSSAASRYSGRERLSSHDPTGRYMTAGSPLHALHRASVQEIGPAYPRKSDGRGQSLFRAGCR